MCLSSKHRDLRLHACVYVSVCMHTWVPVSVHVHSHVFGDWRSMLSASPNHYPSYLWGEDLSLNLELVDSAGYPTQQAQSSRLHLPELALQTWPQAAFHMGTGALTSGPQARVQQALHPPSGSPASGVIYSHSSEGARFRSLIQQMLLTCPPGLKPTWLWRGTS